MLAGYSMTAWETPSRARYWTSYWSPRRVMAPAPSLKPSKPAMAAASAAVAQFFQSFATSAAWLYVALSMTEVATSSAISLSLHPTSANTSVAAATTGAVLFIRNISCSFLVSPMFCTTFVVNDILSGRQRRGVNVA
jgi:hypothetical protein